MGEAPADLASAREEIEKLAREVARLREELATATRTAKSTNLAREAQLAATEAQAHIGRWAYTPATGEITWSKEVYRLIGIAPERTRLSLDEVLDLFHPDDREVLHAALRPASDQTQTVEVRSNPTRGPLRWFNITTEVMKGTPGELSMLVGTQQDITARKRVEQELRESEQRFRQLFDLLPASISFTRKSDHVFLEVNRGFQAGSGLRREDVIGRSARELDLWADAHQREALLRLLDTQSGVRNHEIRAKSANGQELQLSFSAASVVVGGEPGWLSVLTDVTALRQAEQAVRESERRLQLLVENSTDILGVISASGIVLSLRGPLERVLGYEPHELVGGDALELIHPDDLAAVRAVLERIAATPGTVRRAEYRHRHKQGHWVDMEAFGANRLNEPGIGGIVLNLREVSERKRAEREHAKLQAQLQQATKMEAIGRLAGGVAHDFNNLLTAISGNLELARLDLDPSDPLHQYLVEATKAAGSASELTRQLLTFSRRQLIEPKLVNLGALIGDLRKMLTRLIGEDVNLDTTFADDLGSVSVDPGQFQQLLVNLCVNARDAMPDGGQLTIETENTDLDESFCRAHPDLRPGRYVRIAVSDTGQGMSEEVRQRIFEPFFTTKGEGRGTGLGLAMVFGVVKQAGGWIDVYSEVGMGTTFRIYLPRVDQPAEPLVKVSAPAELPRGHEAILLVEDNASVRELAAAMLKRLGYRVLSAANGGEAFLMAEKHTQPIALLLTDVVMPGMNGRELAERLWQSHPETRALFTSGYTEDMIVRHGVMDNVMHYIGKPYSLQALAFKVRRVLDAPAPSGG